MARRQSWWLYTISLKTHFLNHLWILHPVYSMKHDNSIILVSIIMMNAKWITFWAECFMNVFSGNFFLTTFALARPGSRLALVVTLSAIMINVGANNRPDTWLHTSNMIKWLMSGLCRITCCFTGFCHHSSSASTVIHKLCWWRFIIHFKKWGL